MKVWLKDPKTILLYEGQRMAERHMADQVTLISPDNESITIQMDSQTHLPLSRSFQWRDPLYKDKNTELEEYAAYHDVNGVATAYSITRLHNDETVRADVYRQSAVQRGSARGLLGCKWDCEEGKEIAGRSWLPAAG